MKLELYKMLRHGFLVKKRKNIEQEYKEMFLKKNKQSTKDQSNCVPPYKLEIFNNMPIDTACPICENQVHNNENCCFEFT